MKRDRKLRSGLGPEDAEPETGERAVRALDYHLGLIDWLQTAEAMYLYKGVLDISQDVRYRGRRGMSAEEFAERRLSLAKRQVASAPTFFVTGEMARVTKMAADSLQPGGALLPQDLPSRSGLAYLSSGCKFPDYGEGSVFGDQAAAMVTMRAVSWNWVEDIPWMNGEGTVVRTGPGVSYTLWCSGSDVADAYRQLALERGEGDASQWWLGVRYTPFEFSSWTFGHEYLTVEDFDPDNPTSGLVHPAVDWQRRFLLALWSLMGQEVSVVRPVHLKRPEERRRMRMQAKFPEFGDLKIVRLRRQYNPILELAEPEEGLSVGPAREWTHRWWVRDHWAWRRFGPGRAERRRVWIAPYIKGPEDKPLVEKDIIYSLER